MKISILHTRIQTSSYRFYDTNTIRYINVHSKADEITRSIELSLAIGINKNLRKNNNKLISSEEMVRAKVREGSPRGRSETTGGGL